MYLDINLANSYLNGQMIPSMFFTAYKCEGRDRKSHVGFARKISNVFAQGNLVFFFSSRTLRK